MLAVTFQLRSYLDFTEKNAASAATTDVNFSRKYVTKTCSNLSINNNEKFNLDKDLNAWGRLFHGINLKSMVSL